MPNDPMTASAAAREGEATLPETLALLPLRDSVLFPQAVIPLGAGRPSSLKLLEAALDAGHPIGVVAQRDPAIEEPQQADLHRVGTLAVIHKLIKQPDGTIRLVVQGLRRFRIVELTQSRPYLVARVEEVADIPPPPGDLETEALVLAASSQLSPVDLF